jgi:hypothetical protein
LQVVEQLAGAPGVDVTVGEGVHDFEKRDSFGLQIAAMMNDNLVVSATGTSSPVLLTSPNADQTNSLRSTRTLANVLVACVHSPSTVAQFLALTKPPGGSLPHDTAEALADLARNPAQNVFAIFTLPKFWTYYLPGLLRVPDAWTITVKVNDSGGGRPRLFAGLGNLTFDSQGYAWTPTHVYQGTPTPATSWLYSSRMDSLPAAATMSRFRRLQPAAFWVADTESPLTRPPATFG